MIYIFAGYGGDEPETCCIGWGKDLAEAMRIAQEEVREHGYHWWHVTDRFMDMVPREKVPFRLFDSRKFTIRY